MTDAHLTNTASLINTSSIRNLQIEYNPHLADTIYGQFISEESNLKFLSLRGNHISDSGAKNLASLIKVNRSLLILNLWDNHIQSEGAEALAESLKTNQTLASISLGKNWIGDKGAIFFANVIDKSLFKVSNLISRSCQIKH